ncbi:MAG TPA: hypothetical protein PLV67_05675 [Methanofastidiosum sp.]|nr:hypothetical protein [Methanofastidiosum sp.]
MREIIMERKSIEDLIVEEEKFKSKVLERCLKWTSDDPECPYCGAVLHEALDCANEIEGDLRRNGDDGEEADEEFDIICEKCGKKVTCMIQSEITIEFDTRYKIIPSDEDDPTEAPDDFVDSEDQRRLF